MDWRAIPDFPGYELNRRGVIRKIATGVRYGTRASLSVNGKVKWANGTKLAWIVFADKPVDLPPAPDPDLPAIMDELRAERDDAQRSLALARRVNAHQMALIDKLRSVINELEALPPKKRRGRKAKPPAERDEFYTTAAGFDGSIHWEG